MGDGGEESDGREGVPPEAGLPFWMIRWELRTFCAWRQVWRPAQKELRPPMRENHGACSFMIGAGGWQGKQWFLWKTGNGRGHCVLSSCEVCGRKGIENGFAFGLMPKARMTISLSVFGFDAMFPWKEGEAHETRDGRELGEARQAAPGWAWICRPSPHAFL